MSSSRSEDKANPLRIYGAITAWVVVILISYGYFFMQSLRIFDERGDLARYNAQPSGLDELGDIILSGLQRNVSGGGLLVHFSDKQCSCEKLASRNIATSQQKFTSRDYGFVSVDAAPFTQTLRSMSLEHQWLAATPALAVFNAEGRLQYFGPYGGGALCGDTSNTVDLVLRAMADQDTLFQFANSDEFGCYCGVVPD